MANSPFNRLELEAWAPSLDDAVSTGELYAQPLPLTDPAWCNDLGRHYPGPAVAVVDANTYSSGDLFAAGWVDHDIGPLVMRRAGDRRRRGQRVDLRPAARRAGRHRPRARSRCPSGSATRSRSAARSVLRAPTACRSRTSASSGVPYEMTRADLLHGNRDLLAFCTDLLTNA